MAPLTVLPRLFASNSSPIFFKPVDAGGVGGNASGAATPTGNDLAATSLRSRESSASTSTFSMRWRCASASLASSAACTR